MKHTLINLIISVLCLMIVLSGCYQAPTFPTAPSLDPETQSSAPHTQPITGPNIGSGTESLAKPTTPTEQPTVPAGPAPIPTQPDLYYPDEPPCSTEITVGPEVADIEAQRAFVYDCASASYLYRKGDSVAKLYPASITKLVTAYVSNLYLDPDEVITVTQDVLDVVPSDSTVAGLQAGDALTVQNLYIGLLAPSGGDAAHTLSVYVGRKLAGDPKLSVEEAENRFVEEMNSVATKDFGLCSTHFVNCDGYTHYYHYTCMDDLLVIATRFMEVPLLRDIVGTANPTMHFTNGESRVIHNTNYLLDPNSEFYCPEACGLKTGTTSAAGNCLLSAFYVNGRYILIGVFQAPTRPSRFESALNLYDYFRNTLVSTASK